MTTHRWASRWQFAGHFGKRAAGTAIAATVSLISAEHALAQGGQVVGWGRNDFSQTSQTLPSLIGFTQVAAGIEFTVGLRLDGTVVAWGNNQWGQTDVPAGLAGVTQISAGYRHTVVLVGDGTVRAWGLGRVNTGSNDNYGQSIVPSHLYSVAQVAAGAAHTIALKTDGTVVAWGSNIVGETSVPVGLSAVSQVAAGASHNAALRSNGTVAVWGYNAYGQANVPQGLVSVTQVAAGANHTVALKSDGTVVAWGAGRVDTGTYPDFGQSMVPETLSDVSEIAVGGDHTVARKGDGTVVAWGVSAFGLTDVPPQLSQVRQIAAGTSHNVALRRDGSLIAWGSNISGEIDIPSDLPDLTQIAAGRLHTVASTKDRTLVAWGSNQFGQISIPANLSKVRHFAAGQYHTLAAVEGGTVVAWGNNWSRQTDVPPGLIGVVRVAAGGSHSVALRSDGTVVAWGRSSEGQISVPEGLDDVTDVTAGSNHSIALRSDGGLAVWGYNASGQANVPQGLVGVTQVTAGHSYTAALTGIGTVVAWGGNSSGELDVPADLSGVVQIAGGAAHVVALKDDGTVVSWGSNSHGQRVVPSNLRGVTRVASGYYHTLALLNPVLSGCANPAGAGTATLRVSGSDWQQVGVWGWSDGGSIQVPGAMTHVTLGDYRSVGSLCDAHCATLDVPATSTVMVLADLTRPAGTRDHLIDVGGLARLKGRIWLLGSGASVLPADLLVPVVQAATFDGIFSIIQSDTPAPAGKFLTLVPSASLGGGTTWSLALRDVEASFDATEGDSYTFSGTVVDARAIDVNSDGFDDLALAISNGPSQPGLLQVLVNDGQGSFSDSTSSYTTLTPALPTTLSAGDLNGDGRDDVVVGTQSDNAAHIYLNVLGSGAALQGSIAFESSTSIALGSAPLSSAVIPHPDPRVAAGTAASTVVISAPTAGATPQVVAVPVTPRAMGTRARRILSAGPNAGSADGPASQTVGSLLVLEPNASSAYAISQIIDVPGEPNRIDVANIDRDPDGLEDAITANRNPQQIGIGTPLPVLTLFKGTGAGFSTPIPIAPQGASAGRDVSLVDITGDGIRDIVSVHETLVGQTDAVSIQIHQLEPGGPLTIGAQDRISSTQPIFCPRGDVLGLGAEGVFIVNAGAGSSFTDSGANSPRATPYRAIVPENPSCPADIDRSGEIDGADLARLLAAWGPAATGFPADINQDGTISGVDLTLLLAAWGPCTDS